MVFLRCYNLVKWLSYYLYFFSFFFLLDLLYRKECGKVLCHKCYSHMIGSHEVTSHDGLYDECGKTVHRPCSSCIISVENLTETLLSFPC